MRKRADAVKNRTSLLDAAENLFLVEGADVSLDMIADHAGVARATLFRNFADRQALIDALFDRGIDELEQEALRLGDNGATMVALLSFLAARTSSRAPLIAFWQARDQQSPAVERILQRIVAIFDKPLRAAIADGVCRPDLRADDVMLLLSMINGAIYGRSPIRRAEMATKALELTLDAIRLRPSDAC